MENIIKTLNIPHLTFHTGNKIPIVGLGTYEMADSECDKAVRTAIVNGYRHIDTASIYKNEEGIGRCLKGLYKDKLITRQDLFITSKISPYEQGYEKALAAGENILKRLDTEYLDLLIIHWPGVSKMKPDDPKIAEKRLETWKALQKLKEQGKVKDIGVSNFLPRHLDHLIKNSGEVPVLNQFELHPLCINHELIDYCHKNKIVVEAYSSLARKHEKLMKNSYLLELAKKYNKSVAQVALRWAVQNNFVVLPKSVTEKYIIENIDIFDFELEEEELKKISALNENFHTCWDPSVVLH